jgi:hypothetical protein
MKTATGNALGLPPGDAEQVSRYVITARPHRSFHTVLDAHNLLDPARTHLAVVTTRITREGNGGRLSVGLEQQLRGAVVREELECEARPTLRALTFERSMVDDQGVECRAERVDFTRGPLKFPGDTYPEVCLPFLLRGAPFDGQRRSVHAWIADRMVAKVYYEEHKPVTLTVPAGRFEVREVSMYPDLNDWVQLGRVISELAKPLLPKYKLWYEKAAPHRLVRFEGPHGPPGAPEIILELTT